MAGPLAQLADQRQMRRQMRAVVELPQDDVAVGRDEGGARRVVHDPKLHVGRIRRIADVERIEQQRTGVVARLKLVANAGEAPRPHALQIGRLEAERRPFREGGIGRADLDAVVVVGRAVGPETGGPAVGGRPARRVDLRLGPAVRRRRGHRRLPVGAVIGVRRLQPA